MCVWVSCVRRSNMCACGYRTDAHTRRQRTNLCTVSLSTNARTRKCTRTRTCIHGNSHICSLEHIRCIHTHTHNTQHIDTHTHSCTHTHTRTHTRTHAHTHIRTHAHTHTHHTHTCNLSLKHKIVQLYLDGQLVANMEEPELYLVMEGTNVLALGDHKVFQFFSWQLFAGSTNRPF